MARFVNHSTAPDEFAAFAEPDYVKIAWTDPISDRESIFRTETRVLATSPSARARFRRYWAFLSPGIILIRWMSLAPLKAEAERRAQQETRARPELSKIRRARSSTAPTGGSRSVTIL